MAKKKKKKRKTNKKAFNKTGSRLPEIRIRPNPDPDHCPNMPRIIWDCEGAAPKGPERKIRTLLAFLHPNDLRGLYAVRVVPDKAIKTPAGETRGCYYANQHNGRPEVFLSRSCVYPLFSARVVGQFVGRDLIIDTLYHEVGHHMAYRTPGVSGYKGEAFAEKYMAGYKEAWEKAHPPKNFRIKLVLFVLRCLMGIASLVTLRSNRPIEAMRLHLSGKMSKEEFLKKKKFFEAAGVDSPNKGKKWKHPLSRKKYRKKFRIK